MNVKNETFFQESKVEIKKNIIDNFSEIEKKSIKHLFIKFFFYHWVGRKSLGMLREGMVEGGMARKIVLRLEYRIIRNDIDLRTLLDLPFLCLTINTIIQRRDEGNLLFYIN